MLVFSLAGAPLSVSQDATRAERLLHCRSPRVVKTDLTNVLVSVFKVSSTGAWVTWERYSFSFLFPASLRPTLMSRIEKVYSVSFHLR